LKTVRPFIFAIALASIGTAGVYYFRAKPTVPSGCSLQEQPDMVLIPGGRFQMGSTRFYPEEAPVREVRVQDFWIDRYELTNDAFAHFVKATGYVTSAERTDSTGAAATAGTAGSAVFIADQPGAPAAWRWIVGAQWRHPEGPGSSINGRGSHPVVQLSFADASAYARWAGKQLPTEEQWEFAARGGLAGKDYAWGDAQTPDGAYRANAYQGVFPVQDIGADGHIGRAPVGCYPANGYGLFDMTGNVWEWTKSPLRQTDPAVDTAPRGVIRGGSFLCSSDYCLRFRPAARQFQEQNLGTNHLGVRFVRNVDGDLR
jgi:formylglycine-generating enzyme